MYSEIASNKRKSWIIIFVFTLLLGLAGWAFGTYRVGDGASGLGLALMVSIIMTFTSWFAGDSIALSSSGAEELKDRATFPTLWNIVENISITAGIPMPRIYIVQDEAPNAFATGRDPAHASVCVTTGLLKRLEKVELEGVISHEISHIKNYDIRVMMIVVVLIGALSILGNWFIRGGFGGRKGGNEKEGGIANFLLIFGIVVLILSPIIGNLIKLAVSRRREYLADASGALLTRYPEGLARALEKIRDAQMPMNFVSAATSHLWISAPTSETFLTRLSGLLATHPPINDRITRLRGMLDTR